MMLGRCTTTLRPLRHCWKETGLESQLEFGLSSTETPLPAPPKAARLGCGVLPPVASFPPPAPRRGAVGPAAAFGELRVRAKLNGSKVGARRLLGETFHRAAPPRCLRRLLCGAGEVFASPGVWRGFPSPGVWGWLQRAKLRAAGCARTRWHGMVLGSRWHRGLGTAPGAWRLQGAHGEKLGTGRVWGMLCTPALAEKMTAGAIGAAVCLFFISPPLVASSLLVSACLEAGSFRPAGAAEAEVGANLPSLLCKTHPAPSCPVGAEQPGFAAFWGSCETGALRFVLAAGAPLAAPWRGGRKRPRCSKRPRSALGRCRYTQHRGSRSPPAAVPVPSPDVTRSRVTPWLAGCSTQRRLSQALSERGQISASPSPKLPRGP